MVNKGRGANGISDHLVCVGIADGCGIDKRHGKRRERLGDTALTAATADCGAETGARAANPTLAEGYGGYLYLKKVTPVAKTGVSRYQPEQRIPGLSPSIGA